MRFRTKSAGRRRNAGLKLLVVTSALLSTAAAAADPCTAIRNRVLELKKNGTIIKYFPAKMAHDCLTALPLNQEYAQQTADGLLGYHEVLSTQAYYKKPPTPELEIPPHDGAAEIEKIKKKVKAGGYKGLWDFSTDVYNVFQHYRDGHTGVIPKPYSLFYFSQHFPIVSIAETPTSSEPTIWTLNDERKLHKQIAEINGVPVVEYLTALANSTAEGLVSDPDTRFNMFMSQFPTTVDQQEAGFFQFRGRYPGENEFTIKFADGTKVVVEWAARLRNEEELGFFESAEHCAASMWMSDEEWVSKTKTLSMEEIEATLVEKRSLKNGHEDPMIHGVRGRIGKRDVDAMREKWQQLEKRIEITDDDEDEDEDDDDDDDDDTYEEIEEIVDEEETLTPETDDNDDEYGDEDEEVVEDEDDDTYITTTATLAAATTTSTAPTTTSTISTVPQDEVPGYPPYFNSTTSGYLRFYSLDGETAVLDVTSFNEDGREAQIEASDLVDYGLEYVVSTGHKYLIIDLSNNPGGAAFLPFDFTRMLFPTSWVFESVNMRYTKAGLVWTKATAMPYLNLKDEPWPSVDEIFTPVSRDGDKFTQPFRYDHLNTTERLGYPVDPKQTQPFPAENIIVLGNGLCGSSCFAFYEALRQQGVRDFVLGGRPSNTSPYMQTSGGVKGGIPFVIEQITHIKQIMASIPPDASFGEDEDQGQGIPEADTAKMSQFLPGPLRLSLSSGVLNAENQFRHGEEDKLPLEFRYEPACRRFWFTEDMMADIGYTWKFVRAQAWDEQGKPTGCVPEYKGQQHTVGGTQKKKGSGGDPRIPPVAPPIHVSEKKKAGYKWRWRGPKEKGSGHAPSNPKAGYRFKWRGPKEKGSTVHAPPKAGYKNPFKWPKQKGTTSPKSPKQKGNTSPSPKPKHKAGYKNPLKWPKQKGNAPPKSPKQKGTTSPKPKSPKPNSPKSGYKNPFKWPKQKGTTSPSPKPKHKAGYKNPLKWPKQKGNAPPKAGYKNPLKWPKQKGNAPPKAGYKNPWTWPKQKGNAPPKAGYKWRWRGPKEKGSAGEKKKGLRGPRGAGEVRG